MRSTVFIAFVLMTSSFAQAGSVETCCQRAAAEKGHTGQSAQCYASVCQQYVAMKPDGRSCGASGKTFTAYRAALQATCGLSR